MWDHTLSVVTSSAAGGVHVPVLLEGFLRGFPQVVVLPRVLLLPLVLFRRSLAVDLTELLLPLLLLAGQVGRTGPWRLLRLWTGQMVSWRGRSAAHHPGGLRALLPLRPLHVGVGEAPMRVCRGGVGAAPRLPPAARGRPAVVRWLGAPPAARRPGAPSGRPPARCCRRAGAALAGSPTAAPPRPPATVVARPPRVGRLPARGTSGFEWTLSEFCWMTGSMIDGSISSAPRVTSSDVTVHTLL